MSTSETEQERQARVEWERHRREVRQEIRELEEKLSQPQEPPSKNRVWRFLDEWVWRFWGGEPPWRHSRYRDEDHERRDEDHERRDEDHERRDEERERDGGNADDPDRDEKRSA